MARNFNSAPFMDEIALGVDQECGANNSPARLAIHDFWLDDIKAGAKRFVGIADQFNRQFTSRAEIRMRAHAVSRNSDDVGAELGKCLFGRREVDGLLSTR